MELKIKTDDVEIELQEYNELKELIDELSSQHIRANSLCDILEEGLIKQKRISYQLSHKLIIQLSNWCNTDDDASYVKGKPTAIKISKLLFKKDCHL